MAQANYLCGNNWGDPDNAKVADNTYATYASCGDDDYGKYLIASNFGFTVPDGSTIDGIEVVVRGYQSSVNLLEAKLRDETGALVGSAKYVQLPGGQWGCDGGKSDRHVGVGDRYSRETARQRHGRQPDGDGAVFRRQPLCRLHHGQGVLSLRIGERLNDGCPLNGGLNALSLYHRVGPSFGHEAV
jgi:hypothetical protein